MLCRFVSLSCPDFKQESARCRVGLKIKITPSSCKFRKKKRQMSPDSDSPILLRPDRFWEFPNLGANFGGRGCDEALFSEKKGFFSEKGGGNSVNPGFGKDLYRKGNSVKRFGPFTERPDSEN